MPVKRKISEVLSLYEVEPELRDIYVEGITDKLIFDRFTNKYGIQDVEIKEVDDLDFSELYSVFPDIKRNNKKS